LGLRIEKRILDKKVISFMSSQGHQSQTGANVEKIGNSQTAASVEAR